MTHSSNDDTLLIMELINNLYNKKIYANASPKFGPTSDGLSTSLPENGHELIYDDSIGLDTSSEPNPQYEMVNHPKHYNHYDVETVEMMSRIWGYEKTAVWCELTAFKYRMRMGLKPTSLFSEDLKKEEWYLKKDNEYREKIKK